MGAGERIAELEALVARLDATVAKLTARNEELDIRNAELEKLLSESQRAGKRQAALFSKRAPKPDPKRPGRKPGRAHGRHGHRATPVGPPDRELVAPLPGCCPDCGGRVVHERDAEQRQVDLPPMRPVVTRFRVGIGRCAGCGRRVQDRHPDQASDALGAAGSQVGPVAKAWSLWRHYELGLSFGKCARLLRRLGIEVTAGALSQAAQATGTALVPAHQDLVARATGSDVVVVDETGWRIGGSSAWLWVATNEHLTVYNVADRRGFDQACDLVDADYAGTIVRDGRAPYRRYDQASHQTCVAHLLRRCHHLIEDRPAWARGTPRQVAAILHEALAAGDLDDARRAEVAADLPERVELLTGQPQPDDECRKLIAPVRWSRFTVVLDAPQSYHDVSRSSPCGSFHSLRMKWQV